jgi:hypothetical protein
VVADCYLEVDVCRRARDLNVMDSVVDVEEGTRLGNGEVEARREQAGTSL